jgi:hypothetical protein
MIGISTAAGISGPYMRSRIAEGKYSAPTGNAALPGSTGRFVVAKRRLI